MACPAIVGFAAYLLFSRPELQRATGSERAKLWKSALYGAGRPLGFGRDYEGSGLPQVS
jgi:subtilisin